jgi:hypothetical protein
MRDTFQALLEVIKTGDEAQQREAVIRFVESSPLKVIDYLWGHWRKLHAAAGELLIEAYLPRVANHAAAIECLWDGRDFLCEVGVAWLERTGDALAIGILLEKLLEEGSLLRPFHAAKAALKKIGEPIVPFLMTYLAGDENEAWWRCFFLFRDVGGDGFRQWHEQQSQERMGIPLR